MTLAWDAGVLSLEVKQTQSTHDGVPNVFDAPLVLEIVDERGVSARHR